MCLDWPAHFGFATFVRGGLPPIPVAAAASGASVFGFLFVSAALHEPGLPLGVGCFHLYFVPTFLYTYVNFTVGARFAGDWRCSQVTVFRGSPASRSHQSSSRMFVPLPHAVAQGLHRVGAVTSLPHYPFPLSWASAILLSAGGSVSSGIRFSAVLHLRGLRFASAAGLCFCTPDPSQAGSYGRAVPPHPYWILC